MSDQRAGSVCVQLRGDMGPRERTGKSRVTWGDLTGKIKARLRDGPNPELLGWDALNQKQWGFRVICLYKRQKEYARSNHGRLVVIENKTRMQKNNLAVGSRSASTRTSTPILLLSAQT